MLPSCRHVVSLFAGHLDLLVCSRTIFWIYKVVVEHDQNQPKTSLISGWNKTSWCRMSNPEVDFVLLVAFPAFLGLKIVQHSTPMLALSNFCCSVYAWMVNYCCKLKKVMPKLKNAQKEIQESVSINRRSLMLWICKSRCHNNRIVPKTVQAKGHVLDSHLEATWARNWAKQHVSNTGSTK